MVRRTAAAVGILVWAAASAAAPSLVLSAVGPASLVTRGGAGQPMLLANAEIFLQCRPERGHWSADSTQLTLELPVSGINARADGKDLVWADGDHAFSSALHLRGEELTLVARAGALRIRGDRAELISPSALQAPKAVLSGRGGWILSALMGLLVAAFYFRGRARH